MSDVLPEASGTPPAYVFDPRVGDGEDQGHTGPMISARFFRGPDPRRDPVGNAVVDDQGNIPIIELCEIINRNDPLNSPTINVSTDVHRHKWFPREYEMFRQGLDIQMSGTPITEWLGDNARTQSLAGFHIHTVEQLRGISDSLCQTLGPGTYDLRRKAIAYLAVRKDSAFAEKAMAENEALKAQMADMQASLSRLMSVVDAQQAKEGSEQDLDEVHPAEQEIVQSKRRGRPPRIQQGE